MHRRGQVRDQPQHPEDRSARRVYESRPNPGDVQDTDVLRKQRTSEGVEKSPRSGPRCRPYQGCASAYPGPVFCQASTTCRSIDHQNNVVATLSKCVFSSKAATAASATIPTSTAPVTIAGNSCHRRWTTGDQPSPSRRPQSPRPSMCAPKAGLAAIDATHANVPASIPDSPTPRDRDRPASVMSAWWKPSAASCRKGASTAGTIVVMRISQSAHHSRWHRGVPPGVLSRTSPSRRRERPRRAEPADLQSRRDSELTFRESCHRCL